MRALSAGELLDVWERGFNQSLVQRGIALLAAACPEISGEALARLSIGQRDIRLLTLQDWIFGSKLACLVECPKCSERLESTIDITDIMVVTLNENPTHLEEGTDDGEPLSLNVDGCELHFRPPNSTDLTAIVNLEDVTEVRQLLLQRCILNASQDGEVIAAEGLPPTVTDKVVAKMAEADPQADVQLNLTCPTCEHEWTVIFDILSYFWAELDAWTRRTLMQVHDLASAYGWREEDILAMSPWRRQIYLETISA
jgi:hypothetical protein